MKQTLYIGSRGTLYPVVALSYRLTYIQLSIRHDITRYIHKLYHGNNEALLSKAPPVVALSLGRIFSNAETQQNETAKIGPGTHVGVLVRIRLQLFAKILHNGRESGSVTLANQIHFSSRVQLKLVTLTCV